MDDKQHLDIIVPCYNEQECVPLFIESIAETMDGIGNYTYSVYFIDDGSSDDTLEVIKGIEIQYGKCVKYISFSRNFGKEAAIYAGLQASNGDIVVLMDADLQDPPALLPEMLQALEAGYDSCATYRSDRGGEPPVRSFFANMFYRLMNAVSSVELKPGARDFRMMTREMKDAIVALGECERFSKGLFTWVGFQTKWIEYQNVQRVAGKTKWSFFSLLKYAIGGVVAFSIAPLRLASILGFFVVVLGFLYAAYILIRALIYGTNASGFSTIVILLMFIGGVTIFLLGVIGEYLARIYAEVKRRPIYIARETNVGRHDRKIVANRHTRLFRRILPTKKNISQDV
jgi:glycosyltransferase involved in cell wall biosynthesis